MYLIENDNLRVSVRDLGAELTSVFNKDSQIEHLWQADPKFWNWHAPVLFPVVGRCLNDQINVKGQSFPMEKHGFARKSNFKLVNQETQKLSFVLSSDTSTLSSYPFHFDFFIHYELSGHTLIQSFEVVNTGTDVMYFCLGGHPALAVPFLPGEKYEDYYIEFDSDYHLDRWHIDEDGFFDHSGSNIIDGSNRLKLTNDMFQSDAIITKSLKSRRVSIRTDKNKHSLSVEFPDFNYLGLWAKVNAPYVCIEPWLGCADTVGEPTPFEKKEDIQMLPPQGSFTTDIKISVV